MASEVKDLDFHGNGSGACDHLAGDDRLRRAGEGGIPVAETVRLLKVWLEHAGISEGAVFRRLVGQKLVGGPLNPGTVAPIFMRVAQARVVEQVSEHSTRVGARQDLLALNIDLASVNQAGGWKSARTPVRYGEHTLAAGGGVASAAELQKRS